MGATWRSLHPLLLDNTKSMKQLLIAFSLSLLALTSWSEEVPEPLRGIWATPECEAPRDTLAIYRGFYLWMDREQTALTGVTASSTPDDPWTRLTEASGYPIYLQRLEDGRLREWYLPDEAPFDQVPQDDWEYADFESCGSELPRQHVILSGEAISVFNAIDPVYGHCDQDRQACAQILFDAVDVTGDGRLSPAEIARLIRVALFVAAVGDEQRIDNQALAGLLAASLPLAPLGAAAIVSSFDYDHDGTLSMAELSQDRGSLIDQIEGQMSMGFGMDVERLRHSLGLWGQFLENWRR
jgi:hypothetical protein